MNDFNLINGRFHIWLHGQKHEGTWDELYPIIRKDIEVCWTCKANYMNLVRRVIEVETDFGKHMQERYDCPECLESEKYWGEYGVEENESQN